MAKKQSPGFEEQLERLQVIVAELEGMDLPLEKNVALYKEGRRLAKSCKALLEQARHEVLLCDRDELVEFPVADFLAESRPDDDTAMPE